MGLAAAPWGSVLGVDETAGLHALLKPEFTAGLNGGLGETAGWSPGARDFVDA